MQSLSKRLLSISLPPTSLHTSAVCLGIRDKFVSHKDLNKRPSEVEIRKKDLPAKTPTLGERIQRDRVWVFHVSDPKSGYFKGKTGTVRDAFEGKTTKDIVLEGFRDLKNEVGKWAHEVKDDIRTGGPHNKLVQIGDRRTEWKFDTEEDLDQWIYTCDSDWGEGYSTCAVVPSPTGHALFTGELSTRVPQDGRTQKAGYCNMSSVKRRRSFHRLVEFEHWLDYTHLTLRVRGDGRSYVVNIHCHGELDLSWNDLWQFPLYTRGGPYWQETRIPFSKFIFGHRGSVQDKQRPFMLDRVVGVSISMLDKTDGPFALEIDNIGVINDPDSTMNEKHAYESYRTPNVHYIY